MNVIANELIVNEFDCKYLYSTGGLYKVILIASELIGSELIGNARALVLYGPV